MPSTSSWPPSPGSSGSTTGASTASSGTSHPSSSKPTTTVEHDPNHRSPPHPGPDANNRPVHPDEDGAELSVGGVVLVHAGHGVVPQSCVFWVDGTHTEAFADDRVGCDGCERSPDGEVVGQGPADGG